MTNKQSTLSLNEEDDFGFTIIDETEITKDAVSNHELLVEELTDRLQLMYNAIIPLLKNLNKNSDQEIIRWPNRTAKLIEFKKKLDSIGGQYIKEKSL